MAFVLERRITNISLIIIINIIVKGSGIDVYFFIDDTEPVASVDSVKSLGITLNCSLTFSRHISDIVSRAKRSASLISAALTHVMFPPW